MRRTSNIVKLAVNPDFGQRGSCADKYARDLRAPRSFVELDLTSSFEPNTGTEALVGTDEVGIESSTGKIIVIVIDDDPNVIYLLRENLTEASYRVIGAAHAEEGWQKARDSSPFAITLDILMPQEDGWQLLHGLKSDPVTRGIPVIVLSVVNNRKLAYRLGAFECLLKPVEREMMIATLARIAPSRGSGAQ
jgi:CheY-like chemotaxis protein